MIEPLLISTSIIGGIAVASAAIYVGKELANKRVTVYQECVKRKFR
jgi:hypothetical protein